jgi:hypothetical protein
LLVAAPRSGGLKLLLACAPASESATELPLAFTIPHSANRLTAGGAAVARLVAARLHNGLMAPWPVAHGSRRKNFCCVTTRRRNLGRLWRLWRRVGTLTARPFSLGVLSFDFVVLTPLGLPLRRLPALHQTLAFGILAITLVPRLRQVLASTAFAQADALARSSATAFWLIMTMAHGSTIPRDSPGGTR